MSIERAIANLFGRRVVYLLDHDGEVTKRWAKPTRFGLACYRMSFRISPVLLKPDGTVKGAGYVKSWAEDIWQQIEESAE